MAGREDKPRDIAVRGEASYKESIQPLVGQLEKGAFVVIDVESGEFEIAPSDAMATRRLLDRRPTAVTYAVRVGYRAAYSHAGGGFQAPRIQ